MSKPVLLNSYLDLGNLEVRQLGGQTPKIPLESLKKIARPFGLKVGFAVKASHLAAEDQG